MRVIKSNLIGWCLLDVIEIGPILSCSCFRSESYSYFELLLRKTASSIVNMFPPLVSTYIMCTSSKNYNITPWKWVFYPQRSEGIHLPTLDFQRPKLLVSGGNNVFQLSHFGPPTPQPRKVQWKWSPRHLRGRLHRGGDRWCKPYVPLNPGCLKDILIIV